MYLIAVQSVTKEQNDSLLWQYNTQTKNALHDCTLNYCSWTKLVCYLTCKAHFLADVFKCHDWTNSLSVRSCACQKSCCLLRCRSLCSVTDTWFCICTAEV